MLWTFFLGCAYLFVMGCCLFMWDRLMKMGRKR